MVNKNPVKIYFYGKEIISDIDSDHFSIFDLIEDMKKKKLIYFDKNEKKYKTYD